MALVVKDSSVLIADHSRWMDERESAPAREASDLTLWLALFGFSLGLFALWSQQTYIVPIFMGLGYLAIVAAFGRTLVVWRDIFHPLCLVLLICFVRYSLPAFLISAGMEPQEETAAFYRLMGLSDSDWLWAHVLALTSLTGLAFGWFVVGGRSLMPSRLNFAFAPALSHAAMFGMLVGLAALVVFIVKNASLSAIVTGAMRGVTVQEGTGIYFRLIYMFIAGSILLTAYLLERGKKRLALMPVFVCTLFLLTLGGRGRAITPLLAGLLLYWYRNRQHKNWPALSLKVKHVLLAVPGIILGTWLFHFIALYRGGMGLSALAQSFSAQGMWEYLQYSIFAEFGQLHGLAGAVAVGPGVIGGDTFFASLSWPLTEVLPIPGRSGGVYIIDSLMGFYSERRWGLHASLIGDAYLNFGLLGIALIMPVFGMLMKVLYVKFRAGTLNAAFYAFAAIYGVNLFLKSVEAWPHVLTGLLFIWVIIRLADFLNFSRRGFIRADAAGIGGVRSARNR